MVERSVGDKKLCCLWIVLQKLDFSIPKLCRSHHIVQKTPPHNLIINHLYSPTIIVAGIAIGTPIAAQISFGLSIGAIAASPSAMISATCTQDWIEVNTNFLLFNQGTMDTQ